MEATYRFGGRKPLTTKSTKVKTSQTADSDHVKAEVTRKKAG